MTSDSLLEELDFEDELQEEEEYFCSICCDCYDEPKEFMDHINSSEHNLLYDQKVASMQIGDKYCSLCLAKVDQSFDLHCKSDSDHVQYYDSMKRSNCDAPDPSLSEVVNTKQPLENERTQSPKPKKLSASKATPSRKKDVANKLIGLTHLQRQDDQWFCDICLEKFTTVEMHCNKAVHAIQCIKLFDPELAYKIKVSASQSQLRKAVNTLIATKVEEIYEKEKDTPEYLRTMLELERLQKMDTEPKAEEPIQEPDKPKTNVIADVNPGCPKLDETAPNSHTQDPSTSTTISQEQSLETCDNVSNLEDIGEVVSLFEEDDRSFIPINEEILQSKKVRRCSSQSKNRVPARDATMVIGLKHLKSKGRFYYCDLCDVTCKTSLESTKLHMTSSLHRRRMINQFSAHPIPNYLEKLRTKNAVLYNKLIKIESKKLEVQERKDESKSDQEMRAGILNVRKIEALPEPFMNAKELTADEKTLDLTELAKKWNSENNPSIFGKSPRETHNSGANKSTISPIQPQIENLLVGVNAISHLKYSDFHCGLCNIKFDVKPKRNEKHHVNGRLHKKKALIAAYGKEVEDYLQYRSKKEGYDTLNGIINQACVPLEKDEIESETPALREIRAKLLGVKVEQLPLPMVIMYSNSESFDIKKAIDEWKGGKKPTKASSKSLKFKTEGTSSTSVNPKSESSKPVAQSSPSVSKSVECATVTHIDSQSFDQKVDPLEVTLEANCEKGSSARNIFDLCKPMPDASPDKLAFKTSKPAASIKNIDIDGLRKSLVDADLGEFIPVVKANPEKEAATKKELKPSAEQDTPKSSKSVDERNKHRSSEGATVSSRQIKRSAETRETADVKPDVKRRTAAVDSRHKTSPSVQAVGNASESRRTYGNVKDTFQRNYKNSVTPPPVNKRPDRNQTRGNQFQSNRGASNTNNDRQNQMHHNRNQHTTDHSRSNPVSGNQIRNNRENKEDYREKKEDFRTQQRHVQSRVAFNSPPQTQNNDRRGNSSGQSNNSFSRYPNTRPPLQTGNSSRDSNTDNRVSNNRSNASQFPQGRNQDSPKFASAFDVDVQSMKNTSLSSALAKVTNIAPISQACSAQITQASQNISEYENKYHSSAGYQSNQGERNNQGTGFQNSYQNSQGGNIQNNRGGNFGNNQGGNYQNNQQGNFGNNQSGNFGNEQRGNLGNNQSGNFGNEQRGNLGNNQSGNFGNDQRGNFGNNQGDSFGNSQDVSNWSSNNQSTSNPKQEYNSYSNQYSGNSEHGGYSNQSNEGNNFSRDNNQGGNNNYGGRNSFGNNQGGYNKGDNRAGDKRDNFQTFDERNKRPRQSFNR